METLKALRSRVSVSQLTEPFPNKNKMDIVYQSAFRAPDHGYLRPWRFIEVTGSGRSKLANIFLKSAKRIGQVDEEKEKKILALPFRAPMIIIIIANIIDKPKVPRIEQIQSTAAAAQNMLIALYDMGYGAYWRTGNYSSENNKNIAEELSLSAASEVMGYLYVGTPKAELKKIPELNTKDFVTYFD